MDKLALGVLSAVAIMGLFSILTNVQSQVTGAYSWNRVQYTSCHYLDRDSFGTCMRTERQNSTHCSPPETAFRYQGETGWFIRPCAPYYGNERF